MNINKFTQKSMEAINSLEKLAYEYGNQEIDQEHLVCALTNQQDGLIGRMIEKMDINVDVKGTVATIKGGTPLKGASVSATDLRAGASMVIAALCAEGTTEIDCLRHIDRGYEHIVDKLIAIGAQVERIND